MINDVDKSSNKQISWLNLVRVFACMSVVFFHVINGYMKDSYNYTQMKWPVYMGLLHSILRLYHVPTFFCISGFLYQKRIASTLSQWDKGKFLIKYTIFEFKKFINLMIPYYVFSIMYIFLSSFLESDMHTAYGFEQILILYKIPVAQYWYLLTLFFIFLLIPWMILIIKNVYVIFAFSMVLYFSTMWFNIPINGLQSRMVFFVLGCILARIGVMDRLSKIFKPIISIAIVVFVLVAYSVYYCNFNSGLNAYFIEIIVSIILICAIFILCTYAENKYVTKKIVKIAPYTMHIYIIHTWITGGIRVILRHLGIYSILPHVVIGFIIGGGISIAVSIIIKKIWWANIWFEPMSTYQIKFLKSSK